MKQKILSVAGLVVFGLLIAWTICVIVPEETQNVINFLAFCLAITMATVFIFAFMIAFVVSIDYFCSRFPDLLFFLSDKTECVKQKDGVG